MRLFYTSCHWHPGGSRQDSTEKSPGNTLENDFSDVDDTLVVYAAAQGNVDALACLYDRYATLLYSVALRLLKDRESAEELVHDVFLESWRAAKSYEAERATVRTWLLVRLRSRARDRIRNSSRRRELFAEHKSVFQRRTNALEEIQLNPDKATVRRALESLPLVQRQVIELSYFEGLSSREIANRMGTPVGTVKSRSAAGLKSLRVAMRVRRGM